MTSGQLGDGSGDGTHEGLGDGLDDGSHDAQHLLILGLCLILSGHQDPPEDLRPRPPHHGPEPGAAGHCLR